MLEGKPTSPNHGHWFHGICLTLTRKYYQVVSVLSINVQCYAICNVAVNTCLCVSLHVFLHIACTMWCKFLVYYNHAFCSFDFLMMRLVGSLFFLLPSQVKRFTIGGYLS